MSLFKRVDTSMSIEPSESAKGRHRKPSRGEKAAAKRCGQTWSTRPSGNAAIPGVHYDHWCGLNPNHGGKHQCATWTCGETL